MRTKHQTIPPTQSFEPLLASDCCHCLEPPSPPPPSLSLSLCQPRGGGSRPPLRWCAARSGGGVRPPPTDGGGREADEERERETEGVGCSVWAWADPRGGGDRQWLKLMCGGRILCFANIYFSCIADVSNSEWLAQNPCFVS